MVPPIAPKAHPLQPELERGANKFLTKPVDFPQLKQDITAVIAGTQSAL
jgi:CheY-like chemotaxis protein